MTTSRVWLLGDLRNLLLALAAAGEAHGPEYRQALCDVALALGIAVEPRRFGPAPTDWKMLDGGGE